MISTDLAVSLIKHSAEQQTNMLDKIKQAREEVSNHCQGSKDGKCDLCSYCNNLMGVREVLEILDKLIESEE